MTASICSFIDLEGVLVPEMWPHIAKSFGIPELQATTREIPDYRQLLDQRIKHLSDHHVTLAEICASVAELDLFNGAVEFLAALKLRGRVVIVSDSFSPMNRHFIEQIAADQVLCHSFQTNDEDIVTGFDFWNGLAGKHLCFDAVDTEGCAHFAMGDALNDISMIRAATYGVLFQPSMATLLAAPDLRATSSYSEVLDILDEAIYINGRSASKRATTFLGSAFG
ncbi:bifunctional phosphoserine phosphatase/homoserine phosphotransferase ThrH [Agrobacterium vitis]|uniref:bifunctional phosphoserine phosphatase/homoserine phosphotransferase ThrH n=1 Tax=Allorhizobium ampelinum TaxID=3025782 RepID=UPI001F4783A1|nr:bifunctional phosphoserine phosphatase/homoserine phosphotransferase ThrH [Allorhizobium ampelinum]MCF1460206.1 bifunctional phosphoserine phosphatase/homoserine phosphotransferase ThrH [Allorhizobium ampelinum]